MRLHGAKFGVTICGNTYALTFLADGDKGAVFCLKLYESAQFS